MEKINQMVQRFVIFTLQCKPISSLFCTVMLRSVQSDHRESLNRFKACKDEVFQLLALRNLTFNSDVFSNQAEAIWPIKTMMNNTIKSIKTQWTQFQSTEQATNKFIKEMQQLSTLTNEQGVPANTRLQKMRSQMAMASSRTQTRANQLAGPNSR